MRGEAQHRDCGNLGASTDWVMGEVGQRFKGWGTVWSSVLSLGIPSMRLKGILGPRVIFRPDPLEFIEVMGTQDRPVSG